MPARLLTAFLALLLAGCGPSGASENAGGSPASRASSLFEAVEVPFAALQSGRASADTILEVNGGGVALFDGDGDGDLDVLLVSPGAYPARGVPSGGSNRLYRNDGGMRFTDVTAGSGVDLTGFCNGVAVGDVDGDGLRDLYVTRLGGNALLRNLGQLRFERVPDAGGAAGDAWSTSALFVDLDLDGDPDLYVANYLAFDPDDPPLHGQAGRRCTWKGHVTMCGPQGLPVQADRYYRNEGGRFVDATAEAGFDVGTPGYALGVLSGDFDADGRPDVYVSNDSTPNFLFVHRDGRMVERAMLQGVGLSGDGREQAGMGLSAGDLENDGDEDLLVTNFSMESNAVYVNDGKGRFRDRTDVLGIGGPTKRLLGWGVALLDADLDGDLDMLHANGHVYRQADEPDTDTAYAQGDSLWLNDGAGRFDAASWPGERPEVSRALAAGDLDDDGVTDVLILQRAGVPRLWRGTAAGESLQVVLEGPPGNPDLIGAVLSWTDAQGTRRQRVRASAGYQAYGDPRPVFAWRGPGTLRVELPAAPGLGLGEFTLRIDTPGRQVFALRDRADAERLSATGSDR